MLTKFDDDSPVSQFMVSSRRSLLKCAALLASLSALPRPGFAAGSLPPGLQVRKLTWAGVMVETENTALFIDAIAPDEKAGEKDDVLATSHRADALITHHHGDHFDNETLQKVLGKHGRLVCLRATADRADTRGLRVQPVDMWQPTFFPAADDDLVAFAVPAVDGWGAPQASWVIDGQGVRLFHGGDTQWHGDLVDVSRAYGPFDVAFLPINGARQQVGRYVDQGIPAVLTPSQAVAAAKLLHAKLIVPIHFGNPDPPTYVEVTDPLGEFRSEASKARIPVRVLRTGESFRVVAHPDNCGAAS